MVCTHCLLCVIAVIPIVDYESESSEGLVKTIGPHSHSFWFGGSGCGPRFYISNNVLCDSARADLGLPFENQCFILSYYNEETVIRFHLNLVAFPYTNISI